MFAAASAKHNLSYNVVKLSWWIPVVFLAAQLFSSNRNTYRHRGLTDQQAKNTTTNTTDLLPTWLEDYIAWHRMIRSNDTLFQATNILLVDQGVGGLGDRLKSLPYFLWLAAKNRRLLMIHWNTHCQIHEFLQPNTIDWRVNITTQDATDILAKAIPLGRISDHSSYFINLPDDAQLQLHAKDRVVQVFGNHVTLTRGLAMVIQASNRDRHVLAHIYAHLFRLADPVQALLDKTKIDTGLTEDREYIGVHLRARYPGASQVIYSAGGDQVDAEGIKNVTKEIKDELMKLSEHAIHCTKMAYRGSITDKYSHDDQPHVYFASDTLLAMEMQHEAHPNVVYMVTPKERAHFAAGGREPTCSEYYPALVDLWMLSQARCIGLGVGGFSMLATMMNGFQCYTFHQFNQMIGQLFAVENNFFLDETGKLPECLLPPISTAVEKD